jgi:hypothetical protein
MDAALLHRLASMKMQPGGGPGVKGIKGGKAPPPRLSIFDNHPAVVAAAGAGAGVGAGTSASAGARAVSVDGRRTGGVSEVGVGAGIGVGFGRRDVIPEPRPVSVDYDPFPVLQDTAPPTQPTQNPTHNPAPEVQVRPAPPSAAKKFIQVPAGYDPGSTSSSVLSLSMSNEEESSRKTRTDSSSGGGSASGGGRIPTLSTRRTSGTFSPTGRSMSPRLDLSPRSPRAGSIQSPSRRSKVPPPWNSNPVVPSNDVPTGNQLRRSQDKGVIGESYITSECGVQSRIVLLCASAW